jgi:ATP-dependent phosphoenolpyruvate carboxykinase
VHNGKAVGESAQYFLNVRGVKEKTWHALFKMARFIISENQYWKHEYFLF